MSSSSQSASHLYAEQLVRNGHGMPLWYPEPHEATGEVQIGDVGFIDNGVFFRLFNAMKSSTADINSNGVPQGFEPLPPTGYTVHKTDNYLQEGPICTTSVSYQRIQAGVQAELSPVPLSLSTTYTFKRSSDKGAIAFMRKPATLERVVKSLHFVKYMLANYASWHAFARRTRGLYLSPEDIVLVYGHVKTSEWSLTAFNEHASTSSAIKFCVSAAGRLGAEFTFENGSTVHRSPEQRHSPLSPFHAESPPRRDQCMFIRYYKLLPRFPLVPTRRIRSKQKPGDARMAKQPHSSNDGLRFWQGRAAGGQSQNSFTSSSGSRNGVSRTMAEQGPPHIACGGSQLHWDEMDKTGMGNAGAADVLHPSSGNLPYCGDDVTWQTRSRTDQQESDEDEDEDKVYKAKDPLDDLLCCMLEQETSAKIAIASHDDLYNICSADAWPDDLPSFLRRQRLKIELKNSAARLRTAKSSALPASSGAPALALAVHAVSTYEDGRAAAASQSERRMPSISIEANSMERSLSGEPFSTPICREKYGMDVASRANGPLPIWHSPAPPNPLLPEGETSRHYSRLLLNQTSEYDGLEMACPRSHPWLPAVGVTDR
ncbi:hypothetical protein PHLGIDRAFT_152182 [Phlebiopsis gigantea 11061_1 CR5-6]|uniref:Uncharacterized protein n=1 Tax=Phlebiopsis gigantea (strain 11061_1 CR5-6) TaxID=745531 RepID=A0A0C3NKA5_PHLG1|nr:hypothetical protein PHLGIDRAFT_152182 [Phlebiopsis gigantea 11061_1 CR5-6]